MARRSTIPRLTGAALAAVAVVAGVLIAPPAYAVPVTHAIADVQGNAASTPLNGQTVTVEGVVTGDHRTGGYRGIYLQTPGPDTTPGRSDGIFVFLADNPASNVDTGDLVRVTGTARESNTVTQINASVATAVVELVQDEAGPVTPTPLPATVLGTAREAFEGMLVNPTGTYKLVSSHNLQNFGELWLSAGSAMPVEAFESGAPNTKTAADITTANNNARLLLDDGYSVRTDNAAHPGEQPYFTKDVVARNGDTVTFPSGGSVLSFDFGFWRLQPPVPLNDASPANLKPTFGGNPRPATAPVVGGDITVAAFNVLNYFTTLTSQNPEARGADTAAEFAIQKSKIVTAINGLDADIVALQEIENSVKLGEKADEALADLVAGLNAQAGKGTWAYVRTPAALLNPAITDVITNAIIYKPAVVKPSGEATTVIDEAVWGNAREPIAQTFKYGKQFLTVVSNHFKSKSNNPAIRARSPDRIHTTGSVSLRRTHSSRSRTPCPKAVRTPSTSSATSTRMRRRTRSRSSRTRAGPTSCSRRHRGSTPIPSTVNSARWTTSSPRRPLLTRSPRPRSGPSTRPSGQVASTGVPRPRQARRSARAITIRSSSASAARWFPARSTSIS